MPSPELATCGGCALVCDDIELAGERLIRTCPLGDAWFAERLAPPPPLARVDGREVTLDAALDAAAAILRDARSPLVYGLGRATCEAQRAAVALAEAIGGMIDTIAGPSVAFQARGASTATLGDVRDRAEIVVIWRADPVTSHPRLFERLNLPAAGRELVVVDERRTPTAELADTFVEIGDEVEALVRLRTGDDDLARRLRGAGNVAFLHHVGGSVAAVELHALVRDLCQDTHAVSVTLRREANAAGAEDVLAWQTGYPASVSFARGHPREHDGAVADADAALVVGSDPLAEPPAAATERLRAIPLISVAPVVTVTAEAARVAIAPAAAGVYRGGVVHRLDGVPVPLRAPLASDRPGDAEVLIALAERLG
jgi:formylmethanofuran dehydrogenase subunit B